MVRAERQSAYDDGVTTRAACACRSRARWATGGLLIALTVAGCAAERASAREGSPEVDIAAVGSSGATGEPAARGPASSTATAAEPGPSAETVRLRGLAKNAKAGAVLLVAGEPIYVAGLDAWPSELLDREIEASGQLVERKQIPDPVAPDGSIAQGAWGTQKVLEHPSYALAK